MKTLLLSFSPNSTSFFFLRLSPLAQDSLTEAALSYSTKGLSFSNQHTNKQDSGFLYGD